jgi:hypothetical protein
MLALLGTLSFDIKVMSSLFCLVNVSFYGSLLGTTLGEWAPNAANADGVLEPYIV